jgi:SOS-response transcriptional repressor LexA
MRPLFDDGDVLVIDPTRPPREGDSVVIWPTNEAQLATLRKLEQRRRGAAMATKVALSASVIIRDHEVACMW